jgi:hypothetical protein
LGIEIGGLGRILLRRHWHGYNVIQCAFNMLEDVRGLIEERAIGG